MVRVARKRESPGTQEEEMLPTYYNYCQNEASTKTSQVSVLRLLLRTSVFEDSTGIGDRERIHVYEFRSFSPDMKSMRVSKG